MVQKQKTKKKKDKNEDKSTSSRGMVVLPYVEGLMEKVARILKKRGGQYGYDSIHHVEEALSLIQVQGGHSGWCVHHRLQGL